MKLRLILLAGLAFGAVPAFGTGPPPVSAIVTLTGSVGIACHLGSPGESTLNVGTLANQADGTLAPISPQSTTIADSWCNAGSTISVLADPLVAQSYAGTPPAGFTKAVNYTATASGWAPTPASFTTTGDTSGGGNGTTPGSQSTDDPVAQTITVEVSSFATPSAGNRLVADPNYSGTITITLNAAGP
jgi:hypothetical protein